MPAHAIILISKKSAPMTNTVAKKPDTRRTWAMEMLRVGRYPTTVRAYTKGEARKIFKSLLKEMGRLPIGYKVMEVPTESKEAVEVKNKP